MVNQALPSALDGLGRYACPSNFSGSRVYLLSSTAIGDHASVNERHWAAANCADGTDTLIVALFAGGVRRAATAAAWPLQHVSGQVVQAVSSWRVCALWRMSRCTRSALQQMQRLTFGPLLRL
jgi:hypothetical protein